VTSAFLLCDLRYEHVLRELLAYMGVRDVDFAFEVGNEQRFSIPLDRWAHLLEVDDLPLHEVWPQFFAAYRKILRLESFIEQLREGAPL
jgi:hypothetical protein